MNKKLFFCFWIANSIAGCVYGMELSLSKKLVKAVRVDSDTNLSRVADFWKRVDVDAVDQFGERAIHWAAAYHSKDIVEFLLKKGASIAAVDGNGHTPLIWAIGWKRFDTITFLLKQGADLLIKDVENKNALDWARDSNMVRWVITEQDNIFISHLEKLWLKVKLLWLGHRKEQPQNCKFATLPTELICMISDYVWGTKKVEYKKWKEGSAKYRKQLEESEAIES